MEASSRRRSGPVSRLARLLLGGLLGLGALDLWRADLAGWAEPDTATESGVVIITLIMFVSVPDVVETLSRRPWGRRSQALVLAAAGVAAIVGLTTGGGLWVGPLNWLVYGFDLVLLSVISVAMLVSLAVGTPGCEMAALIEVGQRVRGTYDPENPPYRHCVAFLSQLDAWEAEQPWRRTQG
jgi:hypothetical protein